MPGGTTSGLFNHLKKFHSDRFKKVEAQRLEEKGKRSQAGKRSAEDDHRSQKQMRLEDCVPGNSEALEKQIDAAMVDFLAESAVAFRVHVIFFTQAKFLENKIYTEKRQFFALNL